MRIFFVVHGFVQGVGYRSLVKRAADRNKIKGMVKNVGDGSVHILAEGKEEDIEVFKDAINMDIAHGPDVRGIEQFAEGDENFPKDAKGYKSFVIEME